MDKEPVFEPDMLLGHSISAQDLAAKDPSVTCGSGALPRDSLLQRFVAWLAGQGRSARKGRQP